MTGRSLQAVLGLEGPRLTELLADAVYGRGPALLPLAADTPRPLLQRTLATMRPATLCTPEGVTPLSGSRPAHDDSALVIATSGSTGTPKGVELSASALSHSARASVRRIGARNGDDWLCVLPTHHIAGIQVLLRALVTGTEPIQRRFDPATIPSVAAARHPHVSLVPTQLRRLLAAGADLSSFGTILLGGAAADPALVEAARKAGARVVTTYGMSETSGGCVYDGVALDHVGVDVDAENRIRISGPVLFTGYRLSEEDAGEHVTVVDGRRWFRTNDLGELDARSRLRVWGRADDIINSGGYKVAADDVAARLNQHDRVAEAAVVGRADPEWGQRVTAVVVPRDTGRPPSLEELRAWVRADLPSYAAPRELELRSHLPLLPSGKLDLAALRA